jgi:hypothetical protein
MLTKYYSGDQIKKNEEERCIQAFVAEICG